MDLKFEVQIRIERPVADVFSAVYDPQRLSCFFTNGGASGPLDPGTTVEWAFADSPGKRIAFLVSVVESIQNEAITLEWAGRSDGGNTTVQMRFETDGNDASVVRISEAGWEPNQNDLDRSYGNCMGWSQMLSALKAYVEYGIDLRKGAYTGLY